MDREALKESFRQQITLIQQFSECERDMHTYLVQKSWEKLQMTISQLSGYAEKIRKYEDIMAEGIGELKESYGMKPDDTIYRLLLHLPAEERDEWAALFRALRIAIVKMSTLTAAVDSYLQTNMQSLKGMLDEVFPHQKGKIYSKSGYTRNSEGDAMLINKHG
ncbi:MAG: flagellar export chaperone FlgN [Spirochaetia bacterium]